MNSRKLSWLLCILVVLSVVISACAPKATPTEAVEEPTEAVEEPTEAVEEPTEAPQEKTTITMWLFPIAGADDSAYYDPVIAAYTATHPDVEIEIQWIPGDKRMELYLAAVAGESPPDVFLMNSDTFAGFAEAGALLDLTDYWTEDELADFYDNVIADSSWKGSLYMIATDASSTPVIYNKDMFAAAGLDPEMPPTTWAEFLSYCEVLTIDENGNHWGEPDFDADNVVQWCASTPLATSFLAFKWKPWFLQAGGEYFNEDGTEVLFNSEAGLEALEMIVYLADNFMPPSDKSAQYGADIDNFAQGRVAMIPCIENYVTGIYEAENPDLNFGVGPVLKHVVQASHGASTGYSVSSATQNPEAVVDWLKFLTSSENIAQYALYGGMPPARASSAEAIADEVPWWLAFGMEQVQYSRSVAHPQLEIVWEILAKDIEAAVLHQKSPEQALQDATDAINAALAGQ